MRSSIQEVLSRRALLFLLLAQLVVVAPQLPRLPNTTILLWLVSVACMYQHYLGHWSSPSKLLRLGMAVLAVLGIYYSNGLALSLESLLALLISGHLLKLLEIRRRRDVWLLVFIAYFIIASQFLFEQDMRWLLLAALQLAAVLAVQQSLLPGLPPMRPMLRRMGMIILQAMPLLLVLFILFPRIGPLWSMPLPGEGEAKTGLSDTMAPGDVLRLGRSTELAFRVRFDGTKPGNEVLYWRGLVLDSFDGRRWESGPTLREPMRVSQFGRYIDYEITQQLGHHRWLQGISFAQLSEPRFRQDARFQWLADEAVYGRLSYRVRSYPDALRVAEISDRQRQQNLQLPRNYNPRSRALADDWREQYPAPEQRLAAMVDYWREQGFVYTLNPPGLGNHSVDDFLFRTKAGFCEHFASSWVFLLRAAGIPARVVLGYQGGEYNPYNDYLLVRQSDAHAWAEVWMEGRGWQRLDPTALAAPTRISDGAGAIAGVQRGFFSAFSEAAIAARIGYWLDNLDYAWAKWVLNFDASKQWQIWGEWSHDWPLWRLVLGVLAVLSLPIILAGLLLMRGLRSSRSKAVMHYLSACRKLARRGLARELGESPQLYLRRVQSEAPELAPWLEKVTGLFEQLEYRPGVDVEERKRLSSALRWAVWAPIPRR